MTKMTLQAVRQLIANDAYAITFQSMGQYRGALLRHFDSLVESPITPPVSAPTELWPSPCRECGGGSIVGCDTCDGSGIVYRAPFIAKPEPTVPAAREQDATDWKAAHADLVKRNALLRERHDLPVDRIPAHAELARLQEVNGRLRAALGRDGGAAWYAIGASLAYQPAQEQAEPTWGAVKTVGDMVRNLLTLDQADPIHSAFFVDFDGKRRCRTRPITVSRERVIDGKWVDSTRKDIPYATVVWANPDERAAPSQTEQHEAGSERNTFES